MNAISRAFTPPHQDKGSSGDALAAAQARAEAERQSQLDAQAAEDDARRRGLRGSRSLFSAAGGFQGFPSGKDTLGG